MQEPVLDLIRYAKRHSKYFAALYKDIDLDRPDLELKSVPVLNQTEFWNKNYMKDGFVLSSPQMDGAIIRSGGKPFNV